MKGGGKKREKKKPHAEWWEWLKHSDNIADFDHTDGYRPLMATTTVDIATCTRRDGWSGTRFNPASLKPVISLRSRR